MALDLAAGHQGLIGRECSVHPGVVCLVAKVEVHVEVRCDCQQGQDGGQCEPSHESPRDVFPRSPEQVYDQSRQSGHRRNDQDRPQRLGSLPRHGEDAGQHHEEHPEREREQSDATPPDQGEEEAEEEQRAGNAVQHRRVGQVVARVGVSLGIEHEHVPDEAGAELGRPLFPGSQIEQRGRLGALEELLAVVHRELHYWRGNEQGENRHRRHVDRIGAQTGTDDQQVQQQGEPHHEGKHPQRCVEPHSQSERRTGEGVVGRASRAYRAQSEPSGEGSEEHAGDAVHSYAAPVEVPSHDRHEERRDQRGRRSERVTDEQVRCDDSQQSESGGHEPWCGYRNACELDDSRNGHQEYRGKVCGRGVDRNLAWVAGVVASLEEVVGLVEPESGRQVVEVVES